MGTTWLSIATILATCVAVFGLPDHCRLEPDPGHCGHDMEVARWYYNLKAGTCVRFLYNGCGGNSNNFRSRGACLRACTGITQSQPRMMRPLPRPSMPLNFMPLINPYKAMLSGMTPRMRPMMFRPGPGPDVTTTMPPPAEEAEPTNPKQAFLRILFSKSPMSMPRRPPMSFGNMMDNHHHGHPMTVNNYKKSSKMSHFAPRFHKEVVMAPETHDNRFQSHSSPNNRLTLVQVFVNKKPHGSSKWSRGSKYGSSKYGGSKYGGSKYGGSKYSHGSKYSPKYSHGSKKSHGQGRNPYARRGPMRMRGPMRPDMRAPERWFPRFAPPKHFPRGHRAEMDNHVEIETTTYPPDYPKWPKNTMVNLGAYGISEENRDHYIAKDEDEEKPAVGEPNYACLLDVSAGPCKALDERWYFDQTTSQCTKFYYGGCRGNANRFESLEECSSTCMTTSPKPDDTTPYPEDVIVVTENVYGVVGDMEDQDQSEEAKEVVTKTEDVVVTPDPMSAEEKPTKTEATQTEDQAGEVIEDHVDRLHMSSEVEYIIIITVMALVGVIVIILVTFSIAHVSKRCRKGKKERIVEAMIASSNVYNPDCPKLVYYGNTIVPPSQSPDVPDVHTLNKLQLEDKEDV